MRTRVAIIGGGPAGLFLSQLLDLRGIDNVVIEKHQRAYVLARIRAGVLEQGTVEVMQRAGIGARVAAEGMVHEGIGIAFDGELHRIDVADLTAGRVVTVYGQTEITRDLYAARDAMGGMILDSATDVALHDLNSDKPFVTFERAHRTQRIDCEFVVGCDGFHGISRQSVPTEHMTQYHKAYPFGWLGILSATPPVADEVIYASHDQGFSLCSMRNANLSRYYIQVPTGEKVEDWSDARFWDTFRERLPASVVANLETGPSIEKSIAPLRAFVADNLNYGRLFLAGDAGHIVPPTGAKGLNLAVSDVHYLSSAFIEFYETGSERRLNGYSALALDRVWKTVRFSLWCTRMLHRFPDHSPFERRVQHADLRYLMTSRAAQQSFAESYTGLPY